MCTVTFIPGSGGVHLTSNRDERYTRKPAAAPEMFQFPSGGILFPRDGEMGGTWVTMHSRGQAMVLLNGAFNAHRPEPPYRKSRGLVLLELADFDDPVLGFDEMDLNRIEPFTVIMYGKGALIDCRWDGGQKHVQRLDPLRAHIWSSCTLYDEYMQRARTSLFNRFLETVPEPRTEEVLAFHTRATNGDPSYSLLMDRSGQLGTVSITSLNLMDRTGIMQYLDVRNGSLLVRDINFDQTTY